MVTAIPLSKRRLPHVTPTAGPLCWWHTDRDNMPVALCAPLPLLTEEQMQPREVRTIAVLMCCLLSLGSDCGSSSPGSTPASTPSPPAATLPPALQCIVGKTINISGTYFLPAIAGGGGISVGREAEISADLFKVKETGGDELAERPAEETKIGTWQGDYVGVTPDGTIGVGYNEETEIDCFKVEYKRGPFEGPGGAQCVMEVKAKICPHDPCHIEDATWTLTCGVNTDGTGGTVKAHGTWSVQEGN